MEFRTPQRHLWLPRVPHGGAGRAYVAYHTDTQDLGTSTHTFAAKTCYGRALPSETITLSQSSRINNAAIALGPGASMTFLHADGAAHSSPNENSLVVRLDVGGTRVLFMGDAEAGGRQNPSFPPSPQSIEGALLACCAAELAANVLVAGHHGSMTSSRRAFLDAVNPRFAILSSGPVRYGPVTLPDAVIVAELGTRAQVFRTDGNDGACALNPTKIGPDADGRPGGCDSIRIVVPVAGVAQVEVWRGAETP
jgi:competence protein ComEC